MEERRKEIAAFQEHGKGVEPFCEFFLPWNVIFGS